MKYVKHDYPTAEFGRIIEDNAPQMTYRQWDYLRDCVYKHEDIALSKELTERLDASALSVTEATALLTAREQTPQPYHKILKGVLVLKERYPDKVWRFFDRLVWMKPLVEEDEPAVA